MELHLVIPAINLSLVVRVRLLPTLLVLAVAFLLAQLGLLDTVYQLLPWP